MDSEKYVVLNGTDSSIVIELMEAGPPLWRYWGRKLGDNFSLGPSLLESRPTPTFSLDETVAFSIFPTFGNGWFAQSALLAHRAGRDFAQEFDSCEWQWGEVGKSVDFLLTDKIAAIAVTVSMALDDDTLTISSSLRNIGDDILEVQWLAAAALPLPASSRSVHSFAGKHNSEFQHQSDALGRAIWRKENRRGLTSHDAFPGAYVQTDGATYGAQLAWSGNHAQMIEWLDDGRYQWQFGEWLAPGEMRLAPGESYRSPEVLATCSADGKNGTAKNFHAAIRKRLKWPGDEMKPRPVHLNTWEGYYFDHDQTALIALADAAAGVGIERFVLDDGWFNGRDDDSRALGDWWADTGKYPDGLAPLADHVVALDMEFGLWVEPEMVNSDSELFRAHPDWVLQIEGRPLKTARNQLVLDISRDEVTDYLFGSIAKLLGDLPISYLKWDHNRDLSMAGGADGRPSYHKQVEAAYGLFDCFRQAFPEVEIEACAGGGGRIDAGIVQHAHRFWKSDCIDAVSRAQMQPGFLQFMPPETMGSHIGASPAHSTGRQQSFDFRAAVALQGHFGVEFDLVKLDEKEKARLAEWIAFYKKSRYLLHDEVCSGKGDDGIIWHAAGNAEEWLLIVYQMTPVTHRHMPYVRLPFLDRERHYNICRIDQDFNRVDNILFDGSWLMEAGMPVPTMLAESAILFHGCRNEL